jgi:hypothetical protein
MIRPLLGPLRRLTPPLWRRALAVQTFPVPEMGDSITEGTILEFGKKVGDHVALEEMVASVETDKVTVEVRAPAAGTITKLFASIDDTVIVGTDFMEIDVGVGEASVAAPAAAAASPAGAAAAPPEAAASASLTGVYQFGRSTRNHPGGRKSLMSAGAARITRTLLGTRTHARTHARTHTRTHAHTHGRTHARTHAPHPRCRRAQEIPRARRRCHCRRCGGTSLVRSAGCEACGPGGPEGWRGHSARQRATDDPNPKPNPTLTLPQPLTLTLTLTRCAPTSSR